MGFFDFLKSKETLRKEEQARVQKQFLAMKRQKTLKSELQIVEIFEKELECSFELESNIDVTYGYDTNNEGKIVAMSFYDCFLKDLGKIVPSLKKLEYLTQLNIGNCDITDLSLLKELKNLTKIDIFGNDVVDISPLKELRNLTELFANSNQIVDISVLSELRGLTKLALDCNEIVDISPLKELKNLNFLSLQYNEITFLPHWILNFPKARKFIVDFDLDMTENCILLGGNCFENISEEIIAKGYETMQKHFNDSFL